MHYIIFNLKRALKIPYIILLGILFISVSNFSYFQTQTSALNNLSHLSSFSETGRDSLLLGYQILNKDEKDNLKSSYLYAALQQKQVLMSESLLTHDINTVETLNITDFKKLRQKIYFEYYQANKTKSFQKFTKAEINYYLLLETVYLNKLNPFELNLDEDPGLNYVQAHLKELNEIELRGLSIYPPAMKPALLTLSSFWILAETSLCLLLLFGIIIAIICSNSYTENSKTVEVLPINTCFIFFSNVCSTTILYIFILFLSMLLPFIYSLLNFSLGDFSYPVMLHSFEQNSNIFIVPVYKALIFNVLILTSGAIALSSIAQALFTITKKSLSIYILAIVFITISSIGSSLEAPNVIRLLYVSLNLNNLSPLLISAYPSSISLNFILISVIALLFTLLFNGIKIKIYGAYYDFSH